MLTTGAVLQAAGPRGGQYWCHSTYIAQRAAWARSKRPLWWWRDVHQCGALWCSGNTARHAHGNRDGDGFPPVGLRRPWTKSSAADVVNRWCGRWWQKVGVGTLRTVIWFVWIAATGAVVWRVDNGSRIEQLLHTITSPPQRCYADIVAMIGSARGAGMACADILRLMIWKRDWTSGAAIVPGFRRPERVGFGTLRKWKRHPRTSGRGTAALAGAGGGGTIVGRDRLVMLRVKASLYVGNGRCIAMPDWPASPSGGEALISRFDYWLINPG